MSTIQSGTSKRSFKSWSTRDLLTTVVIGLAFTLLLVPVTYAYVALLGLGIVVRSAVGGLYFLPPAFTAYLMRKPGSILLVSLISALATMPFTPYGFIVLLIGVITGILGELAVWLITRYRHFSLTRMLMVGAVAGLLEFALILGSLRTTQIAWPLALLATVISGVVFAVCAAVAKFLADAVARTGVLANTELGRTYSTEI